MNQFTSIDRAVALERVGGELELLREIAKLFLEQAPQLLEEMRAALARADAVAMHRAAHTFRGSVGNFGAEAAFLAATDIEKSARGGDLAAASSALGVLETAWERLRLELGWL